MAKVKMAAAVANAPPEAAGQERVSRPDYQERISAIAYEFWLQRECPWGTPEVDWLRAEKEVRASSAGGVLEQQVGEHGAK